MIPQHVFSSNAPRHRLLVWGLQQLYWAMRAVYTIALVLLFRLKVEGREHVPQQPGFILAGNHTGLLDSFLVMAACPRIVWFFMDQTVLSWAVVGPLLRLLPNKVVVNQAKPREALTKAIDTLKLGKNICIFPEGRLTETGDLLPFQPGVVLIQQKTQAVIIPFTIRGGFEAWPFGAAWPTLGPVSVVFHPPLPFVPNSDRTQTLTALTSAVAGGLV